MPRKDLWYLSSVFHGRFLRCKIIGPFSNIPLQSWELPIFIWFISAVFRQISQSRNAFSDGSSDLALKCYFKFTSAKTTHKNSEKVIHSRNWKRKCTFASTFVKFDLQSVRRRNICIEMKTNVMKRAIHPL